MKNTNSLVQIVKKGGILNERTKNINYFKRASWFEKL